MHAYRILLGAAGWQHASWQGDFYPDGLPEEWRLGFYGNEFRLVLLPAAEWPLDVAAVQQFLRNSGDSPVFLCELPLARCGSGAWAANRQILQAFGPRLLGVVIPLAGVAVTPALPGALADTFRVCIDAGPATQQAMEILRHDERLGLCWYGEGDGRELQHGRLACARIRSAGMNPRGLRGVLEALLAAQDPQRYLAVIVEGDPPSVEVMRQALVLLDLL